MAMGRGCKTPRKPVSSRAKAAVTTLQRLAASEQQMAMPCVQPLLRSIGDGHHPRRLPLPASWQLQTYRRSVARMPCGFDQQAPHVGIAGL